MSFTTSHARDPSPPVVPFQEESMKGVGRLTTMREPVAMTDLAYDAFTAPAHARFLCGDAREVVRPGWSQLMAQSLPLRWRNDVMLSVLGDDADAVIEATVASYRAHGPPLRWLVGPPTRPVDTAEKLVKLGFSRHALRGISAVAGGGAGRAVDGDDAGRGGDLRADSGAAWVSDTV